MTKKQILELKELINTIIKDKLKEVKSLNDDKYFTGYNPIEKIRGSLFNWVAVPFNGIDIFCQLRCPNQTQIEQCGDITNIIIDKEKDYKPTYEELLILRNYQEELCKIVFNIPTFDKIAVLVGIEDFVISEKKKELENIKIKFAENQYILDNDKRSSLESRIRALELQLGYILPDDTMAFITKWAMGNDVTDVKKINKEMFLKAASLAFIHKKAPSDYLSGVFTDFNRNEIDTYAISIFEEFKKEQEIVNQSTHKWFLGGHKKSTGDSILPKRKGE